MLGPAAALERRERGVDTQDEFEAIRRLKYAYFRTLDLKQFDQLGQLMTEDCTAAYEDGKTKLEGRDAIVAWLTKSLGNPGIVTEHHGHHPEIDLTSAHTATGIWYLQDRVIVAAADIEIVGTAFYEDRYAKTEAGWQISHTGYMRACSKSTASTRRWRCTLSARASIARGEPPRSSGPQGRSAGLMVKAGSNKVVGSSTLSISATKSSSSSMSSALTFSVICSGRLAPMMALATF